MFIKKYDGEISPYILPGLLNELKKTVSPQSREEALNSILSLTSEELDVPEDEIKSRLKTDNLVLPRHIFFYLAYEHTDASLKQIGRHVGRDHTTVLAGHRKIKDQIGIYPNLKNIVENIEVRIRGSEVLLAYRVVKDKIEEVPVHKRNEPRKTIKTLDYDKPRHIPHKQEIKTPRMKGQYSNHSYHNGS